MSPEAPRAISLVAGVLGVAIGAALVIWPGRVLRLGGRCRRWLLETDLVALLDRRHSIEPSFYRHHRAFGAGLIIAAGASLAALWTLSRHPAALTDFAGALGAWGAYALILTAWVSAVFALGIGLFVLVRPSAIKGLEVVSNRWLEPFPSATGPGESARGELVSRWVLRAPRLSGALLLAAGLACLSVLA